MRDPDTYQIVRNPDLIQRTEVRIADTAQYIVGGGGNQALLVHAQQALASPSSEVPKFIWSLALNAEIQNHYNGSAVLVEGDASTPGTLTYLIGYIVNARIPVLWA